MDIVVYTRVPAPRAAFAGRKKANSRKGLFVRFFESLKETRRREAGREIAKYAHLIVCKSDAMLRDGNTRNDADPEQT